MEEKDDDVRDQPSEDDVHRHAEDEALAPHQRIHAFFIDVRDVIHLHIRSDEQATHADVEEEEKRPEKSQRRATGDTCDDIATEKTRDEAGDKNTESEGGHKIDHHAQGEATRHALTRVFHTEDTQSERFESTAKAEPLSPAGLDGGDDQTKRGKITLVSLAGVSIPASSNPRIQVGDEETRLE